MHCSISVAPRCGSNGSAESEDTTASVEVMKNQVTGLKDKLFKLFPTETDTIRISGDL